MAKHKGPIEIGGRAVEELTHKFPGLSECVICERIGINRRSMWEWKTGGTPGGYALMCMCLAGCDIKYILTGRRGTSAKESD